MADDRAPVDREALRRMLVKIEVRIKGEIEMSIDTVFAGFSGVSIYLDIDDAKAVAALIRSALADAPKDQGGEYDGR